MIILTKTNNHKKDCRCPFCIGHSSDKAREYANRRQQHLKKEIRRKKHIPKGPYKGFQSLYAVTIYID